MSQPLPSNPGDLILNIRTLIEGLPFSDVFMIVGALTAIILTIVLVYVVASLMGRLLRSTHRSAALRAMKKDETPGNKVLIAGINGMGNGKARNKIMSALESHLPEFNFGSAFYLASAPIKLESTDFALSKTDFNTIKKSLSASHADLIVWGETQRSPLQTRLCFSTPNLLQDEQALGFFSVALPGRPSDWDEATFRSIAYVAGRQIRPSLGRPSDFRAERFQPILKSMSALIEAETPVLEGAALAQLYDDYASGALHVGEALDNLELLNKSVAFREKTLSEITPGDDPVRWSQAKIDLGRAMCCLCEHKFEPVKLQEAMTHLREGIDGTKTDNRLQIAETGFQALQRAEELLASRRRFSIRWSV